MKKILLALLLIALCSSAFANTIIKPSDAPLVHSSASSFTMVYDILVHIIVKPSNDIVPVPNRNLVVVDKNYKVAGKFKTKANGHLVFSVAGSLTPIKGVAYPEENGPVGSKVGWYWPVVKGAPFGTVVLPSGAYGLYVDLSTRPIRVPLSIAH